MDAQTLSRVLLKVAGLVFIAMALAQAPGYFGATMGGNRWSLGEAMALSAIGLGPLLLLGAAMWFFPGTITQRIVAVEAGPDERFGARRFELVALTCVGIYIVSQGFVTLVYDAIIVVAVQRQVDNLRDVPPSLYAGIVGAILQVAAGAAICLGARGIMRVVRRLRRG